MQADMHYYGTYAMARAAGFSEESCYLIAYSAQYVDDNAADDFIEFDDGGRIDKEATAHHPVDIRNVGHFVPEDQRKVWVPFHFLPGNEGAKYTRRLRCVKDSPIAQEMVQNHAEQVDKEFGLYLIGIAAHVYADTFSHYGFSGVSSRGNKVHQEKIEFGQIGSQIKQYIADKAKTFFEKERRKEHGGWLANIRKVLDVTQANIAEFGGALGHGPVATYPDRPFLTWRFVYEEDNESSDWRKNSETFLEGCAKLHGFFATANKRLGDGSEGKDFNTIKDIVSSILKTEAGLSGRIEAWQEAAVDGAFGLAQRIPEYSEERWTRQWDELKQNALNSNEAKDKDIFKFYCAAAYHRNYVLRDLLPKHGLIVD